MITLVLLGDLNLPHVCCKHSREEAVWVVLECVKDTISEGANQDLVSSCP